MIRKRSVSIRGHRTSLSIEDEFWSALKGLAEQQSRTSAEVIAEIDAERSADTSLSSAIRLHVLREALNEHASNREPVDNRMYSHIHLGTNDLEAAFAFWSPLMGALGHRLRFRDACSAGWMNQSDERPVFLVGKPVDGQPARPGNGQMIAFLASSRAVVDATFAVALRFGARSENDPGLRPDYHPNYYGACFRDLDSNKIGVFCHQAVSSSA